jgi:hypothetical protein
LSEATPRFVEPAEFLSNQIASLKLNHVVVWMIWQEIEQLDFFFQDNLRVSTDYISFYLFIIWYILLFPFAIELLIS